LVLSCLYIRNGLFLFLLDTVSVHDTEDLFRGWHDPEGAPPSGDDRGGSIGKRKHFTKQSFIRLRFVRAAGPARKAVQPVLQHIVEDTAAESISGTGGLNSPFL
jgi:hypothetical protein